MAVGVLQFYRPPEQLAAVPFRFALPGDDVEYPLEVRDDSIALAYEWMPIGAPSSAHAVQMALTGDVLAAPTEPGFYRLAVVRGTEHRVVDGPALAVLVPFEAKRGGVLDGYRIGTFLSERIKGKTDQPLGFVKVTPEVADLPITTHLRVGDFLTRDDQTQWPRYAAISPLVLDKLELIVADLAGRHGGEGVEVELNVHSAFRTPLYNGYNRFARDSRHQYGDAIDVAIDANGDGRLNAADTRLVAQAVERVEGAHPDLVGGMGLYTSRKYRQPYVHIDARGRRARWRG
jgi:hypothetical protein